MREATLIATLTSAAALDDDARRPALADVAWLEVRADLLGDLPVSWLRERFAGKLLYTLRSKAEGGSAEGGALARAERLAAAAAAGYDFVDLEAERDLEAGLLESVPAERRVLSWHGPPADPAALLERFSAMAAVPSRFYKLVPAALQPGQALAPLLFLSRLGRSDVVAFASGLVGGWSRLLAPRLGGPLVYGAFGPHPGAPGQPTIETLRQDFGLPALPPVSTLCGILGRPVAHSLSPRLHNRAYRALGLDWLYLPFHVESFGDFWLEVVEAELLPGLGFDLRGFSVTTPFKDVALAVAGAASPLADRIGAANTLVRHDGVWEAEATDPEGVVGPLVARGSVLAGARAAVLGCGGAGRSAAVGLAHEHAAVTLVNRDARRGLEVAHELGLPFEPLASFDPGPCEIVVNATSLGRLPDDPLPLDPARLDPAAIVVDMVYGSAPTPFIAACRDRGLATVEGREVLLHQAVRQFQLMTGKQLPLALGRSALGL